MSQIQSIPHPFLNPYYFDLYKLRLIPTEIKFPRLHLVFQFGKIDIYEGQMLELATESWRKEQPPIKTFWESICNSTLHKPFQIYQMTKDRS